MLAAATVVEKLYGTPWAHGHIYGAGWFVGLWALLAVLSFGYMFAEKLWRRPLLLLLHGAFGVILLGALVTYFGAQRGYLHLRQGETLRAFRSEDGLKRHQLPFGVKLVLFDIEYHPGTEEPADYISFLKADDEVVRVSMNRILRKAGYRLYQYDYDRDEMGTVLLVSHDPWGIAITYAGYGLLGLAMLGFLWKRFGWRGMLCILLPTAAVWFYISRINPMTPVLRTPMLAAHVSVIMVSYALLLFVTVTGLIGLCSRRRAQRFFRWNTRLLPVAVFLLTAGIFIGAVWANISWGRYWGWDAKETWALVTLLVYAVPLHRNSLPALREPKKFHTYCLISFLAVAMTFFGVTYLLGGIHSYV